MIDSMGGGGDEGMDEAEAAGAGGLAAKGGAGIPGKYVPP